MKECKTLACVKEKGVDFCYECPQFPCDKLQPCASRSEKLPHNLKVYNLCRIKQIGLEAWSNETKNIRNNYFNGEMVLGRGPVTNEK
jgi:hypothetical protein